MGLAAALPSARVRATCCLLAPRLRGVGLRMRVSDFTDPVFVSVRVFLSPARNSPGSGGCFCR